PRAHPAHRLLRVRHVRRRRLHAPGEDRERAALHVRHLRVRVLVPYDRRLRGGGDRRGHPAHLPRRTRAGADVRGAGEPAAHPADVRRRSGVLAGARQDALRRFDHPLRLLHRRRRRRRRLRGVERHRRQRRLRIEVLPGPGVRVPARPAGSRVPAAAAVRDVRGQRRLRDPGAQHFSADKGVTMHLTIAAIEMMSLLIHGDPQRVPNPSRDGLRWAKPSFVRTIAAAPADRARPAAAPAADEEGAPAKAPPAPPPVPAGIDVAKLRAEYDKLRDALFRARARAELVEEGVYASKLGAKIRWKGAPDFIMRRAEVLLDGNSIWDSEEKPLVDEQIKVSERPIKPGIHGVTIRLEVRPGKKSDKETEGLGYELEHS